MSLGPLAPFGFVFFRGEDEVGGEFVATFGDEIFDQGTAGRDEDFALARRRRHGGGLSRKSAKNRGDVFGFIVNLSSMAQNPDSIALAVEAESQGIPLVLVGGNAINLHAYFRTTFDADLLIQEEDVEPALEFFQSHGYETFHRTQNFVRLRFAADPGAALPIDLMLADTPTFEKIQQQSRRAELGNGVTLPIPSALHLIARKLHSVRSPARAESGVDLLDVKHLIKTAQIDIAGKEFTELAQRYATDSTRATIEQEFGHGTAP